MPDNLHGQQTVRLPDLFTEARYAARAWETSMRSNRRAASTSSSGASPIRLHANARERMTSERAWQSAGMSGSTRSSTLTVASSAPACRVTSAAARARSDRRGPAGVRKAARSRNAAIAARPPPLLGPTRRALEFPPGDRLARTLADRGVTERAVGAWTQPS